MKPSYPNQRQHKLLTGAEEEKIPLLRMPHSRMGVELVNMAPHLRGTFLKSKGFFGGKAGSVFKVRLPISPTTWASTVTSGVLAQTFGIATNACAGTADWEAVFAEYRIVKGEITVTPLTCMTSTAGSVAGVFPYVATGVNYESTMSAPTSAAQVIQFDQPRVVALNNKVTRTPFDLNRVFGEIWTNGGTYTTFAIFAGYGSGFGATAGQPLLLSGHFDVEYRGLT